MKPIPTFLWGSKGLVEELRHNVQCKDTIANLSVPGELVDPVQQPRVEFVRKQRQQLHHDLGVGGNQGTSGVQTIENSRLATQ